MAYDFKKENRALYRPTTKPALIDVPEMQFITVTGDGDPNQAGGQYAQALQQLYTVAYTIKMSKMGDHQIQDYFDFVVPPLEGFWWQPGVKGVDYQHKETFHFISAIRMPDFVNPDVLKWAIAEAANKKKVDASHVQLTTITEGKCAQIMHIGPYDDEPATVAKLHEFVANQGLQLDYSDRRHHHEIYLSDPRRVKPERMKTVIRIPVK